MHGYRRRAESILWSDRPDPTTVRAFFGNGSPLTAKGKFALARALLLQGGRSAAQNLVRDAWRNDPFSSDLETAVLDVFKDLITIADDKARMDMRLYAEDVDAALRAANRAGGNAPALAKARIAANKKGPADGGRCSAASAVSGEWQRRAPRSSQPFPASR